MARFLRRQPVPPKNGRDATRRLIYAPAGAYTLTCDAGAYVLAGKDATLLKTRVVTADAGAYVVDGKDAGVLVGHRVTADAGSYAVAGKDATLLRGRVVTADPGAYTVAGQDAALNYVPVGSTYTLTAEAGSYALAGKDASLLRGRVVAADAGAYSVAGQDATFSLSSDLIGRKYPRRGRSRPRKIIEIPEDKLPEVSAKIINEKRQIEEDLAEAQADLVSVQLMAHNNEVKHAKVIRDISSAISSLESDLERVQEEEVLIMLAATLL